MSNFELDMKAEAEFAKFLDLSFYPKLVEIGVLREMPKRVSQLEMQLKGIDIILVAANSMTFKVDEKTAINYVHSTLRTFVFELSYLKNGLVRKGWFLRDDLETELYLITWPNLKQSKADELEKKYGEKRYKWHKEIIYSDYENCEVIFVRKKTLTFLCFYLINE